MQQVKIQGILVGSRDGFEHMCRAIDQHELRPVIDRVFPFDESREALAYLSGGLHQGKICIEF
jgi:NADPH:quinone reductase-like Zn-dependent oxidoreductase